MAQQQLDVNASGVVLDSAGRKHPQGYWRAFPYDTKRAAELGTGHRYNFETVWVAFYLAGRVHDA